MLTDKARKIADEAKSKGMWLYDPSYKKWYSPEDFKHIFHFDNANGEFLKKLQLRHPSEGIKAGFQRLTDTQNKLQAFINNVRNTFHCFRKFRPPG
ncbi:MAG TPA: hypothetical protein VK369_12095 [Segetibacter sp.]|nr:hypothetical protein [Segetibacter sp.]